MKTLLITGFEPFGGETINPAWEAVKALPEQIGGWQLRKLQIPTVFSLAAARTLACAAECRPDAVLCIGQAGTRSAVTPEYVGINLRHARIADNLGNQPQDEPVVPGGPTAYFATVPVRAMTAAIEAQGIPAAVSYTAGTYVCNDLLYTLLHHYAETPVRAGFIHVPFLSEQAPQGVASMPLAQMDPRTGGGRLRALSRLRESASFPRYWPAPSAAAAWTGTRPSGPARPWRAGSAYS